MDFYRIIRISAYNNRVLRFTNRLILENIPSVLFIEEKPIKPAIHSLALGDSYSIGEGVPVAARWPEQFVSLLSASGLSIAQPVSIIAKTGWTTDELMHAIADTKLLQQYDWVSLLIGVNNQYRGRSLENFQLEFKQLLDAASQHCRNGHAGVQVLSIPDWGQTPFGAACGRDTTQISTEIDAFNSTARDLCECADIAFLDITALTRQHSTQTQMHAEDGLHPSGQMYQLWAKALLLQGKFGRLSL